MLGLCWYFGGLFWVWLVRCWRWCFELVVCVLVVWLFGIIVVICWCGRSVVGCVVVGWWDCVIGWWFLGSRVLLVVFWIMLVFWCCVRCCCWSGLCSWVFWWWCWCGCCGWIGVDWWRDGVFGSFLVVVVVNWLWRFWLCWWWVCFGSGYFWNVLVGWWCGWRSYIVLVVGFCFCGLVWGCVVDVWIGLCWDVFRGFLFGGWLLFGLCIVWWLCGWSLGVGLKFWRCVGCLVVNGVELIFVLNFFNGCCEYLLFVVNFV